MIEYLDDRNLLYGLLLLLFTLGTMCNTFCEKAVYYFWMQIIFKKLKFASLQYICVKNSLYFPVWEVILFFLRLYI